MCTFCGTSLPALPGGAAANCPACYAVKVNHPEVFAWLTAVFEHRVAKLEKRLEDEDLEERFQHFMAKTDEQSKKLFDAAETPAETPTARAKRRR